MRGILASGLVVAVMALAGCTDEPEPRFQEPTETPTASDSTSSAAAEPEPWEEKSKAGAVAFARHWIDLFNGAMESGETSAMRATSSRQCKACRGYASQIDDLYGDGGHLEGEGWIVRVASVTPGALAERTEVSLRITRSPQAVHEGDGAVKRFPQTKATYVADVAWQGGHWVLTSLEVFA